MTTRVVAIPAPAKKTHCGIFVGGGDGGVIGALGVLLLFTYFRMKVILSKKRYRYVKVKPYPI